MSSTQVKPNHDGHVWLHFPDVQSKGCEGVLVMRASSKRYRVLLVDGSADQVQLLHKWSAASRNDKTIQLEIVWVISHFHADHYGEGYKLVRDPKISAKHPHVEDHVRKVYFPEALGVPPSFPEQAAASLKEAGARLQNIYRAALNQNGTLPKCRCVPLDEFLSIYDDEVRIDVHGGPDRSRPRGPNTRSLIVMGVLQNHDANQDNPFTFVLPGDAEPRTWEQFEGMLDEHSNLNAKLPIAILKLAHHGAENCNPEKVLQRLFGPHPRRRANQVAVRVRNAPKSPKGAPSLATTLQKLKIPVHDTRQDGELWVALRRGASLTKAAKRSEAALGLPAFFQQ